MSYLQAQRSFISVGAYFRSGGAKLITAGRGSGVVLTKLRGTCAQGCVQGCLRPGLDFRVEIKHTRQRTPGRNSGLTAT